MLIKILQIIFNNIMIWGSGSVLAATVPVLYINYDIESNLHANINVLYKNNSEVKLVDGFKGRGLYLNNNCVSLELEKYGLSGEGTIAFWVKPEWDYYNNVEGDLVSYTFASMK